MNKPEIIQDYGQTVHPEVYIRALQGHQYIPQADECIKRLILKHVGINKEAIILDVGCGPGRLTFDIAGNTLAQVAGVDISNRFIEYAERQRGFANFNNIPKFYLRNFANDPMGDFENVNLILMQGVMHHVHGEDRKAFLEKSCRLLANDGTLVIGDEFIKNYITEEDRRMNVAKFYLHIIAEARKGRFNELAEEEAKNLIDDCFSGTEYAGFATKEVFDLIYDFAKWTNDLFYKLGYLGLKDDETSIHNLFKKIQQGLNHLAHGVDYKNFNRGDYKTSITKFCAELSGYGLYQHGHVRKIGPVDELGGMAVIAFKKR